MAVVLIFNHVYWFSQKKNTLGKLVTMATRKRLFLIYKIENCANTQFWKVTKFQGASLFRCGVLSHLLGMGWKTPPPVLIGLRCFDIIQSLCRRSRSILVCILEIDPELISSLQNSILSSIFGEFWGPRFAEFQKGVKIVGLYIKLKTCSRSQKIVHNYYFEWNKNYFTKKPNIKWIKR